MSFSKAGNQDAGILWVLENKLPAGNSRLALSDSCWDIALHGRLLALIAVGICLLAIRLVKFQVEKAR
jgi:hypothetical protein